LARYEEAADLLVEGNRITIIAEKMGITPSTVVQYLQRAKGEGLISNIHILFSFHDITEKLRRIVTVDRDSLVLSRDAMAKIITDRRLASKWREQFIKEYKEPLSEEEFSLYFSLMAPRALVFELFRSLYALEIALCQYVKERLIASYGEDLWWADGVSVEIRKQCAIKRQHDYNVYSTEYDYVTLIDLSEIIDKRWSIFRDDFQKNKLEDKKGVMQNFRNVNTIRNQIMHPSRKYCPTYDDLMNVYAFTIHIIQITGKNTELIWL